MNPDQNLLEQEQKMREDCRWMFNQSPVKANECYLGENAIFVAETMVAVLHQAGIKSARMEITPPEPGKKSVSASVCVGIREMLEFGRKLQAENPS